MPKFNLRYLGTYESRTVWLARCQLCNWNKECFSCVEDARNALEKHLIEKHPNAVDIWGQKSERKDLRIKVNS